MNHARQTKKKGTADHVAILLAGLLARALGHRRSVGCDQAPSHHLALAADARADRRRALDSSARRSRQAGALVTAMSVITPDESLRNEQHVLTERGDYLITNSPLFHRQIRPSVNSKKRKEASNGTHQ
jgi:hypothetical protein